MSKVVGSLKTQSSLTEGFKSAKDGGTRAGKSAFLSNIKNEFVGGEMFLFALLCLLIINTKMKLSQFVRSTICRLESRGY